MQVIIMIVIKNHKNKLWKKYFKKVNYMIKVNTEFKLFLKGVYISDKNYCTFIIIIIINCCKIIDDDYKVIICIIWSIKIQIVIFIREELYDYSIK